MDLLSEYIVWLLGGAAIFVVIGALAWSRGSPRKPRRRSAGQSQTAERDSVAVQAGRDIVLNVDTVEGDGKSDARRRQLAHDRSLYRSGAGVVEHSFLDAFLQHLEADHTYYEYDARRIDEGRRFLSSQDNRFINQSVAQEADTLLSVMGQLLSFLALNFFVYPPNQTRDNTRFCMQPALNADRDGAGTQGQCRSYNELADDLAGHIGAVRDAYARYRKAIRIELVV